MNITKFLVNVFVIPDYSGNKNVVRRVQWIIRFEKNGFQSDAFVETLLDVDKIDNFIPANEIGNDRVLQWAYDAQGGQSFIDELSSYHLNQIDYQIACSGQESYTEGFDIFVQFGPSQIPATVL